MSLDYRRWKPCEGTRSAKEKPELSWFLFWIMSPLPSGSAFFAIPAPSRGYSEFLWPWWPLIVGNHCGDFYADLLVLAIVPDLLPPDRYDAENRLIEHHSRVEGRLPLEVD